MYNKKLIKVDNAKKLKKPKDVIIDPEGQWKYPGQITKILSGDITMQGVPYPVFGVDDLGNEQMMYPGGEYTFPGNSVTEYPQMRHGGPYSNMHALRKKPHGYTSSNIMTSVNEIMKRNETLYGPWGSKFYKPTPSMKQGGWLDAYQDGAAVSPKDSLLHQYGRIADYEYTKGSAQGTGLSNYGNPALGANPTKKQAVAWMDKNLTPKLDPYQTAMEKGEAADFIYNTGKDPRAYALQEFYRKYDKSKLDADGKWAGRRGSDFDNQYKNTIGKLPENDRRILMNKGRDWYYQNINNPSPGVPNDAYEKTWKPRIWESVNEYQDGGGLDYFQVGGDKQKEAYAKYQQNIVDKSGDFEGKKFFVDTSNMPDAKNKDMESFNCIGGACNFNKEMGADVPVIPGNSTFWEQAQAGDIPVKVYADSKTEDYEDVVKFIQPGDFIGHDYPVQRDEDGNTIYETDHEGNFQRDDNGKKIPTGGRNAYYPEHSQVVIKNDPEKREVWVMDAQRGNNNTYEKRKYSYDDIGDKKGLISGGPYGKLFVGRPTSVNGRKLDFDYPKGISQSYFPEVSKEELNNLKPLKWSTNKEYNLNENLDKNQQKKLTDVATTLSKEKKNFIKATGMSEQLYDDLAKKIPGIAYQETKLGKTDPDSSTFQVEKNLLSGDVKDAWRTFTEDVKQDLGSMAGKWTSKGMFQVKDDILFNSPETRVAMKRLGITKKNYDPSNVKHNMFAAMVMLDNISKTSLKNFDKVQGNNPDLSTTDKLLYLYNNPSAVRKGEAEGDAIYNKNVNSFNALTTKPVEQYAEKRDGGWLESYQDGGEQELESWEIAPETNEEVIKAWGADKWRNMNEYMKAANPGLDTVGTKWFEHPQLPGSTIGVPMPVAWNSPSMQKGGTPSMRMPNQYYNPSETTNQPMVHGMGDPTTRAKQIAVGDALQEDEKKRLAAEYYKKRQGQNMIGLKGSPEELDQMNKEITRYAADNAIEQKYKPLGEKAEDFALDAALTILPEMRALKALGAGKKLRQLVGSPNTTKAISKELRDMSGPNTYKAYEANLMNPNFNTPQAGKNINEAYDAITEGMIGEGKLSRLGANDIARVRSTSMDDLFYDPYTFHKISPEDMKLNDLGIYKGDFGKAKKIINEDQIKAQQELLDRLSTNFDAGAEHWYQGVKDPSSKGKLKLTADYGRQPLVKRNQIALTDKEFNDLHRRGFDDDDLDFYDFRNNNMGEGMTYKGEDISQNRRAQTMKDAGNTQAYQNAATNKHLGENRGDWKVGTTQDQIANHKLKDMRKFTGEKAFKTLTPNKYGGQVGWLDKYK